MTINRLLRDPLHKGLRIITREAAAFEHTLPAIVDPELWERCNQLLKAQDDKTKPREKRTVYLFSGLLTCHCQSKLYAESSITPGRSYRCCRRGCRNSIRFVDLERWFYERFTSFFCSPDAHLQHTSQTSTHLADKELLLQSCRQQLQRLGRDLEKIRSAFLAADDPAAASLFVRHETEYAARRQALETQIATLTGELDALRLRNASTVQGLSMAQTLALTWPELTPAEQRRIIEQIVDGILIGETDGELHLAYLPEVFEFSDDSQKPRKMPANCEK